MTGFLAEATAAWAPYLDWDGLVQDFALFLLVYAFILIGMAADQWWYGEV